MKVTVTLVLCSLFCCTPSALSRSIRCRPGHYITDSKSCRKCPRGSFQPDADQTNCKPCPDGTVSMKKGSTKCVKCGKNKTPSEFKNECICVVGAIPDQKGNCNLCKPGTYFEKDLRKPECRLCWPGSYQPDSGKSSCANCPDGTASAEGARKCLSCPKGQFPLRNGECGTCPPGQTSVEEGYCQDCYEGTFKAKTGTGPCIPCPLNATSGPGASKCEPGCPKGEARIGKKAKCGKCPAGFFYVSRFKRCRKCRRGYFMPYENVAGACLECAGTSFTESEGSKRCIECPMGQKLLKKNGTNSCGTCPLGTVYNSLDLACEKCGFNHYATGSTHDAYCTRCAYGGFSLPGASTCFACSHGQALIGKTRKCGVCPAGFFYDMFSGARCVKCDEGSFLSSPGIEDYCRKCPEGTKSNNKRTACISE